MTEQITSVSNPKIKNLAALQQKSSERRRQGLFVVEGRRELEHCLEGGYVIDSIFLCPEIAGVNPGAAVGAAGTSPDDRLATLDPTAFYYRGDAPRTPRPQALSNFASKVTGRPGRCGDLINGVGFSSYDAEGGTCPWGCPGSSDGLTKNRPKVFGVSRAVYEKIAYREGTEGIIAEVRCRQHRLEDLQLRPDPLICVLESVEKPGNLGAVLRSADAAGADAIIVCDPKTDIYNPNLIRASIGAAFTVPVAVCDSSEAIGWLKAKGIKILTAQLQDSELYYDSDMSGGTAIVMGTEDKGLSGQWREAADAHIRIPMLGRLDSLNVSVSAAILLFEALRQRNNG